MTKKKTTTKKKAAKKKEKSQAEIDKEVKDEITVEIVKQNKLVREYEKKAAGSAQVALADKNILKESRNNLSELVDKLDGDLPLLEDSSAD